MLDYLPDLMTLHRFYIETPHLPSANSLDGPEAHHAIKVLRVSAGARIELFDGRGNVARATITGTTKRELQYSIDRVHYDPLASDHRVHFAIALPKGDRQRSVIEKLIELGVDSLIPLHTRYSVAEVDESNRDRLLRYGLEACKQCRRNRNLDVLPTQNAAELCRWIQSSVERGTYVSLLHPPAELDRKSLDDDLSKPKDAPMPSTKEGRSGAFGSWEVPAAAREVAFLIGPEGGFTDAEASGFELAGARRLELGARILRVETAVATAAVMAQTWFASRPNTV